MSTVSKPTYEQVVAALRVALMAYNAHTTRDALRLIGLGHEAMFPAMPGDIKSVSDAAAILSAVDEQVAA